MAAKTATLGPRDIIVEIGRNMESSKLELMYRVIVPSVFEVVMHPADYAEHAPSFHYVRDDAMRFLSGELHRLNSTKPAGAELLDKLGFGKKRVPVERDGGAWSIEFLEDPNEEIPRGGLMVSSRLRVPVDASGARTRRTNTVRFEDGARSIEEAEAAAPPRSNGTSGALAHVFYQDGGDRKRFDMTQPEVSVGRGGDGKWVDIQIPKTKSISKEHLLIRFDAASGRFEAKDVSSYGTLMDGRKMESGAWTTLGPSAVFELARGVTLEFQALR